MGRYPGRRVFLTLPPEAAHRLANGFLSLPLPWRRIGGGAPEDPRLHVTFAGIPLANPIGLGAGFDKTCAHLDHLGELGFGYVVGGTITLRPREGKPKPRIVRDPADRSMANAMGLPNPGAEAAARRLARTARTAAPRLLSLADEVVEDVVAAFQLLEPHVDGFELNASSPNAGWRHEEAHVATLVRELSARTEKPIIVKLPRFEAEEGRDAVLAMAVAARDAGASGLTCSNTRPVEEPRLGSGRGGLSGSPLTQGTPVIVREVRRATGGAMPISASGGIFTAADALACIEAGATTVQIYTGLVYEGPGIVGDLARGLLEALHARGTAVPDLVGTSTPAV
jgi:dihydroorotate dehydrogenase